MDYDIERKQQEEKELRKAFREIFPLAEETDLPWAPCHIKHFIRSRLKFEVDERVHHFTSRVVRVLCEISPPKSHVDDMCRIVVTELTESRARVKQLELQIAGWQKEALLALAGIVPTPEKGYVAANGGSGQFRADAQKLRELFNSRQPGGAELSQDAKKD